MKEERDTAALSSAVFDLWRMAGKESELQVRGWSMRPLIDYEDTVVVKHTLDGIRPGSIIAFKRGRRIIIHRVLRKVRIGSETIYVNKGDSNPRRDPLMRERAVIGRVVAIVKKNNKRINVESPLWRLMGYMMIVWGAAASVLPSSVLELRFTKFFKRVMTRIVCVG
ncbi:MAG: hypothetical protein HW412_626 [Bacteroidetes bacterium]|nr:hypothetical protein [Bacteroidota bacterium]